MVLKETQGLLDDSQGVRKRAKTRLKDVAVITILFWLIYSAYNPLESLQSSLNPEAGLGVASVGLIYGIGSVMVLLAGGIVQLLSPKWSIVLGSVAHTIYIGMNSYPTWWTLMPSAVLVGIGGALHWVAAGQYVTSAALDYSTASRGNYDHLVSLFQGVFFMGYATGGLTGGIISSQILQTNSGKTPTNNTNSTNQLANLFIGSPNTTSGSASGKICGLAGCPWNSVSEESVADADTIQVLMKILLSLDIIAVLLAATCLSRLVLPATTRGPLGKMKEHMEGVVHLLKESRCILLVPSCFYGGLQMGFFASDFTQVNDNLKW